MKNNKIDLYRKEIILSIKLLFWFIAGFVVIFSTLLALTSFFIKIFANLEYLSNMIKLFIFCLLYLISFLASIYVTKVYYNNIQSMKNSLPIYMISRICVYVFYFFLSIAFIYYRYL